MPTLITNLVTDVTTDGGIDTNRYSSTAILRAFTKMAHMINAEVMRTMKDNDFQGERSLHDLIVTAGVPQREYLNPSDLLKLKRVDLKLDGVNFRTASFLDANEVNDKLIAEADIISRFSNDYPKVDIMDESYFIYSGSFNQVTGGIMLWYDKDIVGQDTNGSDITDFSATTDVSTLVAFAAQALVIGAIINWYEAHPNAQKLARFNKKLWGEANPNGRPDDDRKIGGLMRQIINHYSDRVPDRQIHMSSAHHQDFYENDGSSNSSNRFGPR